MGSQVPNGLSLPLTINLLQCPCLRKKLHDTPNKPFSVYKYTLPHRLQCPNPCGLAVRTSGVNAASGAGVGAFYSGTLWALKDGRDVSITGVGAKGCKTGASASKSCWKQSWTLPFFQKGLQTQVYIERVRFSFWPESRAVLGEMGMQLSHWSGWTDYSDLGSDSGMGKSGCEGQEDSETPSYSWILRTPPI